MMSSMKPAPLQFVKLAPSDLYRSAQDQLNKAAVVTKPKPKEFDAEWQSDLDNWKSNRRKQQEHIIERLVEVKKFETDRLDDGFRKRSKTFNEMIQERGRSGRLRSLPALYQDDDDGNDLSDLGLSAGKKSGGGGGDDDQLQQQHDQPSEERAGDETCGSGCENENENEDVFRSVKKPADADAKTAAAAENGFDRAIKDYVDFAESKRTSRSATAAAEPKRRMSAPKIEEKVMLLKTRSLSAKDLHSAAVAELPKVDVVKRREIFEKAAAAEVLHQQHTAVAPRHQQAPLVKRKPLETTSSAIVVPVGHCVGGASDRDIRHQVIEEMSPPGSPPSPSENDETAAMNVDQRQPLKLQLTSFEEAPVEEEVPPPPPSPPPLPQRHHSRPDAAVTAQRNECGVIVDEPAQRPTADDQEKPIVALEKERVQLLRDDGYGLLHHVQQLSSLSDPASRHSVDSLDMHECGGLADPDDGNYPGSCVSAEDSGIHTEDMSSCVSQADDEEQRSNLQPSPPAHHQHMQQHHHSQPPDAGTVPRHDDDAYINMVLELTPVNALEPPKEKPPPPPIDVYPDDDQMHTSQEFVVQDSMESAKRIKKEMWMKRSSFLGLEEYCTNGGYEHDLENLKSKPPDLTSFLEEERRLEKLLYNQNKPERHDNTRIYENVSSSVPCTQHVQYMDDGDNESSQYMRDILQVEEQSRCNQMKNKAAQNNIGEKLVKKLKELEEDLNNQESARVGSAHWLPPTRHSMQDVSIADGVAVNAPRPPLDHTQSMPNLEQPVHSQHRQSEDFTWSAQNICSKPVQQNIYAKRKPINSQPEKYNYQHWLIQEAEHRRLVDKCNRQVIPPGAIASNQPRSRSRPALPPPPPPSTTNKKPLPDSVINTLTQRVQDRLSFNDFQRHDHVSNVPQESMLSVSGKKKCSHCSVELGRGAAMIIESLQLFYHIECFKCCVCCVQLGDGLMGTDVRVRNKKLHCHNCFSSDDGVKFSCV